MPDLPVVCVFGVEGVELKSAGPIPPFETDEMDCRCYPSDKGLYEILARDRPVAIVSFGKAENFPVLTRAPFHVRKMWIHYLDTNDMAANGSGAFHCFLNNALVKRDDVPLVSVFTPAFRTGDKIQRPFHSLLAQTYNDWEWVIVDDSDDNDETFKMISELAKKDFRVRLYKADKRSGVIGNVKKTACGLARGEFLVELDHDDELTPMALKWIVDAYRKHPEAGFVYTDFAECYEDGTPHAYGPGWGFGYGSYREEVHNGIKYMVVNSPRINAKTIRHIVAAPNHIRSWRKSVYDAIGGHNEFVRVADDYELMVRTFLSTRMALIQKMCYVQYRNQSGNASQIRNRDIQRMVRYFSNWYEQRIHARLLELGVDDFVWAEGQPSFGRLGVPNPGNESHCTILVEN
jgi:glycosyltransferase involved in cell wall biosynthesis